MRNVRKTRREVQQSTMNEHPRPGVHQRFHERSLNNLHWKCMLVSKPFISQWMLNSDSIELSFLYFWPSGLHVDSSTAPSQRRLSLQALDMMSVNTPHPKRGFQSRRCTLTFSSVEMFLLDTPTPVCSFCADRNRPYWSGRERSAVSP